MGGREKLNQNDSFQETLPICSYSN